MGLTDDDVREILRIIDESELEELRLELPGMSLHVRRGGAPPAESSAAPLPAAPPAAAPPAAAAPAAPVPAPVPSTNGAAAVESPMLGTFYRAEAPGERPFVEVGDTVEPDTVVCLIEVMKLMNHIQAGVAGTVVEVLAGNAELVEFRQPLFRVAPPA
jgi:acetyl-CoA carboxylase biotin carboxyl carrier protein